MKKRSLSFFKSGSYICRMNTSLLDFLDSLFQTLDQSVIDYKAYLSAGKTFRYARVLKTNNDKALALLSAHKALLPTTLIADAEALIKHYQVWTHKWEALARSSNPDPDDEFVFPNSVTFPRESVARLEACFHSLKQA